MIITSYILRCKGIYFFGEKYINMEYIQLLKKYIIENKLIDEGDSVLICLSGGADSVSLIHMLKEIESVMGLHLYSCHINHGLREDEAERDLDFSRKISDSLGIEFYHEKVDVKTYCMQYGLSIEEGARLLRYNAIFDIAENIKSVKACNIKIATAHNANDKAETTLFNLVRGSGLKGLSGIDNKRQVKGRDLCIVRPILFMERNDIEHYLENKNIPFVFDSTNNDNYYSRNTIRNIVLPCLSENINKQSIKNINKASDFIRDAYNFIDNEANKCFDENYDEKGLRIQNIKSKPSIIREEILKKFLVKNEIGLKDISSVNIRDLDKLIFNTSNRKIIIKGNICIYNEYGYLHIYDEKYLNNSNIDKNIGVNDFEITVKEIDEFDLINKEDNIEYLDYEYIRKIAGDDFIGRFKLGQGNNKYKINIKDGSKSFKALMRDEKVGAYIRDKVKVVFIDNIIICIPFIRIDYKARINFEGTNKIKVVCIKYYYT